MSKQLQIVNAVTITLDDEDFERISKYKWNYYGFTIFRWKEGTNKRIPLANAVLEEYSLMYDHKDRNKFNNTKENLRPCNHSQNAMNRTKRKHCSSQYKGVGWCDAHKKFRAYIRLNGKLIHLGWFSEENQAAIAYNNKAKELFGEFAHLNTIKDLVVITDEEIVTG